MVDHAQISDFPMFLLSNPDEVICPCGNVVFGLYNDGNWKLKAAILFFDEDGRAFAKCRRCKELHSVPLSFQPIRKNRTRLHLTGKGA